VSAQAIVSVPELPQDAELKTAFAAALLRYPDDAYTAATTVIPDLGKAMRACTEWVKDPFVRAEQLRLLGERGAKSFLATKEDQAKDIYALATKSMDEEIRLKAHRLYAEIMGNIEKPSNTGTVIAVQNVMIVKDHGDDTDWERKAVSQQRILTGHASTT
jgi:hypothetical protein